DETRQGGRQERGGVLASLRAPATLLPVRVARSFIEDDGPFLSGALAYQIFFALIPLLALVVGVLGFVFGDESSSRRLAQLIREVYPSATQQELRIVRDLIQGRALSLGLGLVGTLFGATAIYTSLDFALAAVLGRGHKRTFVRG